MKRTEFRQLIKEQYKLLKEIDFDKIYHVRGILITDDNKRALGHIMSDIRSLPGVTIARVEEIPNQEEGSYSYKSILHTKIDPYPYIRSDKFSHAQSSEIVKDVEQRIRKIDGVISIKFSSDIQIQNN
jgi:nitrate reductase NapAB chaperone NapD